MNERRRVFVIGGGAAGMSAASRVKRVDPNSQVVVLEATDMVSHAPCAIPYYLEGLFTDTSKFMTYTPDFFRSKRGIDVRTRARLVDVDYSARKLEYESEGSRHAEEFDYLVISTGARPKVPPIEGARGERVFYVHHPSEAEELAKKLNGLSSVAVVGAGTLGVELSEAMSALGKKVTVIHRGHYPMSRIFDEELGKQLEAAMASKVALRLGESLTEIKEGGRRVVTDKGSYEVDGTFVALGIEPNVVAEGLKLGDSGAISTGPHMETSVQGVFAAGDVAESKNLITGLPDWQPYAPVANKMGYVAGANAAGRPMVFPGVIGTVITKFYELVVGKTGLNLREAQKHGFRAYSATIKARSKASYYPGSHDFWVTLVAEEGTGRILGGQVMGQEEVLGRLDVIATAVTKGMNAEELLFDELGYMPAVAGVWDPLIIAARQLLRGD